MRKRVLCVCVGCAVFQLRILRFVVRLEEGGRGRGRYFGVVCRFGIRERRGSRVAVLGLGSVPDLSPCS